MNDTYESMGLGSGPDDVVIEHLTTEVWMQENLKVLDTDGNLVQFIPNEVQKVMLKAILMQRKAGKPVRIIILKSRREGISTVSAAYFFARTHLKPYHQAFVSAHDDEGCKTQWRIVERFEENLATEAKLPLQHGTAHELTFSHPHGASYRVQTAGNEKMGSGAGYTDLHLSELAKWAHDKTAMTSIMQTVPDKPHTTVIIEATANGSSGTFYEMWQTAVQRQKDRPGDLDGFIPLFFTALTPEHSMPVPDNYACAGMDEEELIWKDAGASPEQLYWRRMTIENKCHGDVDQFNQEYPITPDVAFLASGRPAIDPAIVKHHRTQIVMPDRARLVDDERYERGVRIEFGRFMDSQGGWNIYEEPMEGADYTIGVDTCTGVPSNPTDKFSKPDSHAIVVLRRDPKRIAAVHRSRMDADRLGQEALRAGKFYLMAWVAPEIANGSGMTVLNVLRDAGYLRVYHREAQGDSVNLEEVHKLGWKTTRNTRDWLIDDWLAACRKDPSLGWDFTMQVPDAMLVEEESTFVWNVDKREHKAGCHDDILFAAMIALQLDKRCCRTHSFNRIGEQKFNPFDGPMWMNGRDPGIPELQPDYNLRHVEYLS